MYFLGPHVSAAGGVWNAPERARALGATGFALFVKNQRQWMVSPVTPEEAEQFRASMAENGFRPEQVMPHAGYLINLANPDPEAHEKSVASLIGEMQRCAALGLCALNVHPGSHLRKISPEEACARVAESVCRVLAETEGVTVVLENTAGSGGCLGSRFSELGEIVRAVDAQDRVGVCIDTAHAFAAGYDLRTADGFQMAMEEFDREVGFRFLRGMHLNDSKPKLGSHVDRHASLGLGEIGLEPFRSILRDHRFTSIPLILETPDETRWADEVRLLQEFGKCGD